MIALQTFITSHRIFHNTDTIQLHGYCRRHQVIVWQRQGGASVLPGDQETVTTKKGAKNRIQVSLFIHVFIVDSRQYHVSLGNT